LITERNSSSEEESEEECEFCEGSGNGTRNGTRDGKQRYLKCRTCNGKGWTTTREASSIGESDTTTKGKKKYNQGRKRGTSGWIEFGKEMRPGIKAENPDMAFDEQQKALSTKWKAITADKTAEWNAKAKVLNDARPPPEPEPEPDSDSDSDSDSEDDHIEGPHLIGVIINSSSEENIARLYKDVNIRKERKSKPSKYFRSLITIINIYCPNLFVCFFFFSFFC
jgi:hypothetical protein